MRIFEYNFSIFFVIALTVHLIILTDNSVFAIFLFIYSMYWFLSGIPILLQKSYNDAFKETEKDVKFAKYLVFSAGCGIIISFGIVGVSFKLLQWPRHETVTYPMLICQFVIIALSLFFYNKTKNRIFTRTILRMGISILFLSYFLFLYQL